MILKANPKPAILDFKLLTLEIRNLTSVTYVIGKLQKRLELINLEKRFGPLKVTIGPSLLENFKVVQSRKSEWVA